MAAKFDKDMLIKHRFWILISVVLILALAPTYLLSSNVSEKVKKEKGNYDSAKGAAEKVTSPKNEKFKNALEKKDEYVAAKKNEVHEGAWLAQKTMYTYPERMTEDLKKLDVNFGEKIERIYTRQNFAEDYKEQLPEVVQIVQPRLPWRSDDEGLVQFLNNDIATVMQLRVNFSQGIPDSEDIWLAQEDLWVKRELLRVIREANDSVAKFKPVSDEPAPKPAETKPAPAPEKPKQEAAGDKAAAVKIEKKIPRPAPVVVVPPKDPNHRTFKNPHWEVELWIKTVNQKTTVAGKIKNIGDRRRPLGIYLKVLLQKGPDPSGVLLPVMHEALAVGESCDIPEFVINTNEVSYQGLYGVEEVLTWKTAPVKRIDALVLGYPSSRTAEKQLVGPTWPWMEKPPDAGGAPGAAPAPAAPTPPADDGGGGRKRSRRGEDDDPTMNNAGGNAAAFSFGFGVNDGTRTRYGLRIKRYTDYNEQVRHMPIGMVVIADAEHMSELLSAFANSRLRVQITQTHWQVSREKIAPITDNSSSPTPGTGPRPNMPTPGAPLARGRGNRRGDDDPTSIATAEERGGAYFRPAGAGRAPTAAFSQQRLFIVGAAGGPGAGFGGRLAPGNPAAEGDGGMKMGGGMPGMPGMPQIGGYLRAGGFGEDEENLQIMEVSVYGIASLYQPFPPKPPKPADAAAGATAEAPK